MIRTLRPEPDEIAVVLVSPGDVATVETERGPHPVRGMDPTDPYPEVRLALVPFSPAAVGFGETHSVSWGVGLGGARTPTGLRITALRRVLRGHKHDEPVWAEARDLLGGPTRAVYVRVVAAPYYGRTRHTATGARAPRAQEVYS